MKIENRERHQAFQRAFSLVLKALESPSPEMARVTALRLQGLELSPNDAVRIIRQARERYELSRRESYLELAPANAVASSACQPIEVAPAAKEVRLKAERIADKLAWRNLLQAKAQMAWARIVSAQKKGRVTWQGAASALRGLNKAVRAASFGKEVAAASLPMIAEEFGPCARRTIQLLTELLGLAVPIPSSYLLA